MSGYSESVLEYQILELAGRTVPMHMPGHKRNLFPSPGLPYSLDLTEIEGADNLHDADGILRQAMDRTAALWRSSRTWYLVGGSTCGILAGIRAVSHFGSEIIVARNCHKAVYHAVELGNYRVHWLFPAIEEEYGICGSIRPDSVKSMIRKYPGSTAVVLTSPTYEGVISDIAAISQVCHRAGIPLFVDEAHGAHLGLFPEGGFPESAVRLGADLVVQSAHKTLPSLTQTALLHLQGDIVDAGEVERQLNIFETSSPSYPLMISLDSCTGLLRERGPELFAAWRARLGDFDSALQNLSVLQIMGHGADRREVYSGIWALDSSKILIGFHKTGHTGREAAGILRRRYGIEVEMEQGRNVLAMTGCGDRDEDLEKLAVALLETDRELGSAEEASLQEMAGEQRDRAAILREQKVRQSFTILEASGAEREAVRERESAGRICAEYIYVYPPGVPVLAPGEVIGSAQLKLLSMYAHSGDSVFHSVSKEEGSIAVLRE